MAEAIKIGFTGTQRDLTEGQKVKLLNLLQGFYHPGNELHQGDCIGADQQAVELAKNSGYRIVRHGPKDPSKRAYAFCHEDRPLKPYLVRNHEIVDETEMLIACPGEKVEQLRSGTWATVRYARKKGRIIQVIYP